MSNIERIQKLEREIADLENEVSIYDSKQMALKILLNSGYGAFANTYFHFYDIRIAKSITYTAQLVTKWIIKHLNENNITVVYSDTDSVYLCVSKQVKKYCKIKNIDYETLTYPEKKKILTLIDNKIQEIINAGYDKLSEVLNVQDKTFKMDREIYGNKGIWLGKKNYIIKMINKDGIDKLPSDKPYVKGYDIAKKAATTPFVIGLLEEYVELVFDTDKDHLIEFEREKFKKYKELKFSQLFSPKGVNALNNYKTVDTKGAMAHIKAALVYNKIVDENNLHDIYPLIVEGSKIKYSYIIEPNIFRSNTIGFHDEADGDKFIKFAIDKYGILIDWNKMWNTDFVKPAHRLTDALSWDMSNVNKNSFASFLKKK